MERHHSENFGLTRKTQPELDATNHLEAAVSKMLTERERVAWRMRQMVEQRAAEAAARN
jgi:hypothetical protein